MTPALLTTNIAWWLTLRKTYTLSVPSTFVTSIGGRLGAVGAGACCARVIPEATVTASAAAPTMRMFIGRLPLQRNADTGQFGKRARPTEKFRARAAVIPAGSRRPRRKVT